MKQDILDYLGHHNVWFNLEPDLTKVLPEVDVVYITRIEQDRALQKDSSVGKTAPSYFIDDKLMRLLPSNSLVMHPLPRLTEIACTVDNDARAAYFRQTRNGVLVRMALLVSVLG